MAHAAINTKDKLMAFKRTQLEAFFMEKFNSKIFLEASKKANMPKYEKQMNELKAKIFDAFHETIKNMES